VLGSHGAAALPLAAPLLAWGRYDRLELCSGPETGIVVWRPLGQVDLDELRARMERGFVSITELDRERRLRSVSANPMADPELVVAEVLRAATG
jgi:L-2,4-diaminobutyrate decarboxylase